MGLPSACHLNQCCTATATTDKLHGESTCMESSMQKERTAAVAAAAGEYLLHLNKPLSPACCIFNCNLRASVCTG